ncbi:alpha/beta hydrolase [Sporosarcina sp. ANT_H38]|uniref:alpha/beta hydrolase n=1 Tax=Sporosarcina sp. ANT_H38 TaxID=2597358 RepID=UPI0011F2FCB4|nr:alpha/beta hydrolase [Sporosarcina sp. ANT_H38]KAA0944392.1 alpha/beta hydrolase [Sporosarcina sp. ANT_H38]
MERKYSKELLDKLVEREETIMLKGVEVLVKNLPDSDEKGAMDPRLYKDMKNQLLLMKYMPKFLMKMDISPKGIKKLRKMFNGVKSNPIVKKNIEIEHRQVTGEDGNQIPIRIYTSETIRKNAQVLYFIHGGGFFGGSPDVVEEFVKLIVENTDILAVSVDYRLAPENPYPAGHKDCYSTLKWIYDHAESLGGDRSNIFVAGDSAGGNLTQYCTTRDMEDGLGMVKGQLLLYPTVNMAGIEDEYYKWSIDEYEMSPKHRSGIKMMLDMFGSLASLGDILGTTEIDNDYLTPYKKNPKGLPPTFITVGEHDFLKVESLAYAVKLAKAGVETKTVLYKGFGHAYADNVGVYPQSEDCAIEVGKFILEHTK